MVRLEAVARARHVEPAEVLKSEALKIATGSVVKVVIGRYSGGIGGQRRTQADFSVTEAELRQFLKLNLRGGAAFRLQSKLAKMNTMTTYGGSQNAAPNRDHASRRRYGKGGAAQAALSDSHAK